MCILFRHGQAIGYIQFHQMEVGTVNVKQLGKAFNLDDDPKGVVEEYNSLFLD